MSNDHTQSAGQYNAMSGMETFRPKGSSFLCKNTRTSPGMGYFGPTQSSRLPLRQGAVHGISDGRHQYGLGYVLDREKAGITTTSERGLCMRGRCLRSKSRPISRRKGAITTGASGGEHIRMIVHRLDQASVNRSHHRAKLRMSTPHQSFLDAPSANTKPTPVLMKNEKRETTELKETSYGHSGIDLF
ncbi:hypothetical protein BU25DRAFT_481724 [Macroventuria anomochaeta]|uniref:Uncharacterized protein n=1 Tax=Macroventuria anomochaeta TaxID=301207 RepID=A0ACB6SC55_9PLEO|nr:uncharacterized protein BU25DRAFT_481724 [Macroventuria anomochaeta]KAF2631180.1 hypothetical protein BU25DRAFT_481724 [Macroventuria anomochaeta]